MLRVSALIAVSVLASSAAAQDLDQAKVQAAVAEFRQWAGEPVVTDAVKAQNAAHAALTQADIDAKDLQWRAEAKLISSPMISAILANDLSQYLSGVKDNAKGVYTEIFVMDNKGLNVGQSDVTSDYWQGDEEKFTETFGVRPEAVHVSEVEYDESTQTYQVQISIAVVDSGLPVGAMTVGMDAEALQ